MNTRLTRREKISAVLGAALALLGLGWFRLSAFLGASAGWMRQAGLAVGGALCRLWSLVPFPVSELVWIGGVAAALGIAAHSTLRRGLWGFAGALCRLVLAGGVMLALFSFVFLVQYSAPPLSEELGLEVEEYTPAQLAGVAELVAGELNKYADMVPRDGDGLFAPAGYDALAAAVGRSYAQGSLQGLYARGTGIAPKQGALLSRAMSYLSITGYYFPLTGESIVSGDLIETSIPFTIAHEAAHAFGVGPEKEANFAAFLCCIQSEDPEVCYSGLFNGYIYLNNALYRTDRTLWQSVYDTLSQPVRDDLAAKSRHLARYEGPVNAFGSSANNAYIQATGQPDGVQSYGRMVDLMMAWYLQ